jgi:MoaA/NifB/PqqE/SkfB family radical SAM enzyme
MPSVTTLDFHITSRCKQSCPYCAPPQLMAEEIDTQRAAAIVRKVRALGVPRLVFTGGDPLLRPDAGLLLRLARQERLEVALATPGDVLTPGFVRAYGRWIDLLSLPLDGPSEAVSSLTKKPGHFDATLRHLKLLGGFPRIDVKITTAATRRNLDTVPELLTLLDQIAPTLSNRLAIDICQVHPRGTAEVAWQDLVVSDGAFAAVRAADEGRQHPYRVSWLDRCATDGLYLTILPDGRLSVVADGQVRDLGPLLEIRDLEAALAGSGFDASRHLQHARTWSSLRREEALARQDETVAQ